MNKYNVLEKFNARADSVLELVEREAIERVETLCIEPMPIDVIHLPKKYKSKCAKHKREHKGW